MIIILFVLKRAEVSNFILYLDKLSTSWLLRNRLLDHLCARLPYGIIRELLFHESFFKVLGKVGTHSGSNMIGCHLLHVVSYHDANEFLE